MRIHLSQVALPAPMIATKADLEYCISLLTNALESTAIFLLLMAYLTTLFAGHGLQLLTTQTLIILLHYIYLHLLLGLRFTHFGLFLSLVGWIDKCPLSISITAQRSPHQPTKVGLIPIFSFIYVLSVCGSVSLAQDKPLDRSS